MAQDDHCPLAASANIIGAKWTLEIIHHLRQRRRFCDLQEVVGGVNPRTLSQRLKFLEQEGIVQRYAISNGPPHVEYELTQKGLDLLPILDSLSAWADQWVL